MSEFDILSIEGALRVFALNLQLQTLPGKRIPDIYPSPGSGIAQHISTYCASPSGP